MKQKLNSKFITAIVFCIGYYLGSDDNPNSLKDQETIRKHEQTIAQLNTKLKENTKETVEIIQNVDGSKVTRKVKTKDTVKQTEEKTKTKTETKTEITYTKFNAIGVRPYWLIGDGVEAEIYGRAGTKCFIFNCYAEGSYLYLGKKIKAGVGLEFRF